MRNMTLVRIAGAVDGQLYINGKKYFESLAVDDGSGFLEDLNNREASSVVIDSRKADTDCIFVATVGERVDGHSFIRQVLDKGALGVICEKIPSEWDDTTGVELRPYILVEDSFVALKKLAKYYREQMAEVKCIGIVGSVGKTSTKELVASVLSQSFNVHKTEGNFNNEVGVPLTVLGIRDYHEAAVIEMGISDFGEMSRLGDIVRPDAVVMTNIGPCHLEKLGDLDGVLKAKSECIPYIDGEGFLVINSDDDHLSTIGYADGRRIITYGSAGDVSASEIRSLGLEGSTFRMNINTSDMQPVTTGTVAETASESAPEVFVPLPGAHMVQNALAAAAVGLELGMELHAIINGIREVKPVSGRSNLIRTENYLLVDDCYNANPKSMKAAIDLLSDSLGRRCAILGDMFELGEGEKELHAEVGEYALEHGLDMLVCCGRLSKNMADAYGEKCFYFETLEELLNQLDRLPFEKGDTILIKASHGMKFSEVVKALSGK